MASPEEIQGLIMKKVEAYAGKKQVKVPDLTKEIVSSAGCEKKDVKAAIKELIDSGKLVYGYFGGSTLELPHTEGSANV